MFGLGGKMIGIEITDQQLKLIEIAKKKKRSIITKYMIESIPAGWIQNGVIQKPEEMQKLLKMIRKKLKIGHRPLNLAINSPNILLRPIQLPKMDKNRLNKAIEMEITNNIQLPFQQYTYDYAIIPEREVVDELETEEQKQELMLVIAAKEMLEQYVNIFQKARLKVANIDLAPISFLRLLERERKNRVGQLFVGINLHESFVEISIFSEGILRLSRNIAFNLRNYVMSSDADDEEMINYVNYSADLIREVERILNFFRYTLNHREQQLTEIILAGNLPSKTEPIFQALSNYFHASASTLSAGAIHVHKKIVRGYSIQAPLLTIPIGLALKDVKA